MSHCFAPKTIKFRYPLPRNVLYNMYRSVCLFLKKYIPCIFNKWLSFAWSLWLEKENIIQEIIISNTFILHLITLTFTLFKYFHVGNYDNSLTKYQFIKICQHIFLLCQWIAHLCSSRLDSVIMTHSSNNCSTKKMNDDTYDVNNFLYVFCQSHLIANIQETITHDALDRFSIILSLYAFIAFL